MMFQDNDYEAYFGSPASPDAAEASVNSLYMTETTLLQRGPRERTADDNTSTVSLAFHQRGAGESMTSMAGWTVTSQLIQPKTAAKALRQHQQHRLHDWQEDDREASTNFVVGRDYSMYDLPVYDTDDGHYTDIDLTEDDDDDQPILPGLISSSTDPQLIIIANEKKEHEEDDEDDKPRKTTCLSRLCVRFLA